MTALCSLKKPAPKPALLPEMVVLATRVVAEKESMPPPLRAAVLNAMVQDWAKRFPPVLFSMPAPKSAVLPEMVQSRRVALPPKLSMPPP